MTQSLKILTFRWGKREADGEHPPDAGGGSGDGSGQPVPPHLQDARHSHPGPGGGRHQPFWRHHPGTGTYSIRTVPFYKDDIGCRLCLDSLSFVLDLILYWIGTCGRCFSVYFLHCLICVVSFSTQKEYFDYFFFIMFAPYCKLSCFHLAGVLSLSSLTLVPIVKCEVHFFLVFLCKEKKYKYFTRKYLYAEQP